MATNPGIRETMRLRVLAEMRVINDEYRGVPMPPPVWRRWEQLFSELSYLNSAHTWDQQTFLQPTWITRPIPQPPKRESRKASFGMLAIVAGRLTFLASIIGVIIGVTTGVWDMWYVPLPALWLITQVPVRSHHE